MIPWNKLPKDLQKTILTLMVMSSGANLTSCCPPVICDPPPPPSTRPSPPPPTAMPTRPSTPPPIIFDPAPPPSITPTRSRTAPLICDPPPPPLLTRTPQATSTPMASRRFQLRNLQMAVDSTLKGAAVRGTVYDRQGQPLGETKVSVQTAGTVIDTVTARNGTFFLRVSNAGAYQLIIGGDVNSALALQLKEFDVANTEWAESNPPSHAALPLAEIRTVDIIWGDGLTFGVETPWSNAQYRWSVSGGMLVEEGNCVTWLPPSGPGRYLLQVVADWQAAGLAVDSMVLAVDEDGNIVIS